MESLKTCFILPVFLLIVSVVFSQTDTVRIPDNHVLNTKFLKPGPRQYLVYIQSPQSPKSQFMWFWKRNIEIKEINHEKVFVISQEWLASDTAYYEKVYSVNHYEDFAPLYHRQQSRKGIEAYQWSRSKIMGDDTVKDNEKKGFRLDFKSPNLNWNLDMETFEMLPLDKNKVFAINFYDAGSIPPDYVIYKVIGEERISTYGSNQETDCWKLYTEGSVNGQKYTETYWISKKDHEMLKEKDDYGGGAYRYKIKMPVFARP